LLKKILHKFSELICIWFLSFIGNCCRFMAVRVNKSIDKFNLVVVLNRWSLLIFGLLMFLEEKTVYFWCLRHIFFIIIIVFCFIYLFDWWILSLCYWFGFFCLNCGKWFDIQQSTIKPICTNFTCTCLAQHGFSSDPIKWCVF